MTSARYVCLFLIAFILSACGDNPYQVYELKEAAAEISRGELPPNFKYPKNTLYIDGLKIRIAPCKPKDKCSKPTVSELHMAAATYFSSTLTYARAIFSTMSPGNAKLEENYMSLYTSVKELVANNDMVLKLSARNAEAMEKAYADWQKKQ